MKQLTTLVIIAALLFASCSKDDESGNNSHSETVWTDYTVAVVAPLTESAEYREHIERIAGWFSENFDSGQSHQKVGVRLNFEWHDESALTDSELTRLGSELANREDIAAVVGPFYSKNVDIIASRMFLSGKPLVVPVATSDELQRKYSVTETGVISTPFMWCISPSDVSQAGLLLSTVAMNCFDYENPDKSPALSLISPTGIYGKTFYEWIPYQAIGMGLDLRDNLQYEEADTVAMIDHMNTVFSNGSEYIICVPASATDAQVFAKTYKKLCIENQGKPVPKILYSDATFNASFLSDRESVESARGTAMYAAPSSGFRFAYESRYGELPTPDDCMLYDAFLLTGMACCYSLRMDNENLNEVIDQMVSSSLEIAGWNSYGIEHTLDSFGDKPQIVSGTTGNITFKYDGRTSRLEGFYAYWQVTDGKFVVVDCVPGSYNEALSKWNQVWSTKDIHQSFDDNVTISYGPLKDRWALLVCSSDEWENYRHAADVLGVYQLLKSKGYDDEHIILIFSDTFSGNPNNLHPGEIRRTHNEPNLLKDVQVDYTLSDVSAKDISDIMLGHRSDRLPVVLQTDSASNVFLYWTGHGDNGYFVYPKGGFTAEMLRSTVSEMSVAQRYRKLLICAEPCHSGSMVKAVEGIRGVLGIASSYPTESSFANDYDYAMKIWMNDRFTSNLIDYLTGNGNQTYDRLYQYLWEFTLGSHVNISNASCYANLYTERLSDYFTE